jgi:hypothetical protein
MGIPTRRLATTITHIRGPKFEETCAFDSLGGPSLGPNPPCDELSHVQYE